MVLAQEQDIVGGNFTTTEAFYGHISQVNVWDSILTENEIQILASSCALDRHGNLVAWGDFLNNLDGNYQIVRPSQACQGEKKFYSPTLRKWNIYLETGPSKIENHLLSFIIRFITVLMMVKYTQNRARMEF